MRTEEIKILIDVVKSTMNVSNNVLSIDWLCENILNFDSNEVRKFKITLKREKKLKRILGGEL